MNEIDPILTELIQLIDNRFEKLATTFSKNYEVYNEKVNIENSMSTIKLTICSAVDFQDSMYFKRIALTGKTVGVYVITKKNLTIYLLNTRLINRT
jgi:hypothetical protein